MDEDKRDNLYEAVSLLETVYNELDSGTSLEAVDEEIAELADYEGVFEGDVGERVDQVADLSQCIDLYLSEYEVTEEENVSLEDVLRPLEQYDAEVEYNGHEDGLVEGDPGLTVVMNTIGENGVEHGKDDGSYQIWGSVEDIDEFYRLEVWDNGSGLPEDMDPGMMFEKGVGENTGKGLFLAREIIEEFGGSIRFDRDLEGREDGFGLEILLNKASGA